MDKGLQAAAPEEVAPLPHQLCKQIFLCPLELDRHHEGLLGLPRLGLDLWVTKPALDGGQVLAGRELDCDEGACPGVSIADDLLPVDPVEQEGQEVLRRVPQGQPALALPGHLYRLL